MTTATKLNEGIENTVTDGLIQSVIEKTDLNWSVSKKEIQTIESLVSPENVYILMDKLDLNKDQATEVLSLLKHTGIKLENKTSIIRDDKQISLGVFADRYTPFQNDLMLKLVYQISQQSGLEIHKSGLFGNGEKVYVQLKNEEFKLPDNDRIETYFTAVNSFDGTTQFGFGSTDITISCRNTFMGAYRSIEKMKHTQNMLNKIDKILYNLDEMRIEEQQRFDTIIKMGNVKIDSATKLLVTKLLFDIKQQDGYSFNELIDNEGNIISTRKQNQIITFNNDLAIETAQKGDNLWGLISGVTRFTTHSMNKDNTENKMFGALGYREREIFNRLATIAG